MHAVLNIVVALCHIAVALVLPLFLRGVIIRTKALFAGRVGAPLLQPYYDLVKLLQKGSVFSTTTTWVFRVGPVVSLVAVLVASLLMPFGSETAPISFRGDALFFVYLLALARFSLSIASLDTGSSFEGMGTTRELTFACLAEPALFFGLLVTTRLSHSLQLSNMLGDAIYQGWQAGGASLVLVLVSWFIVLLAENSRIPFDDPNTHLELTMIHEVMVLDHSGPALGMILYGAALKLFLFCAMIVQVLFPLHTRFLPIDWALFVAEVLLVGIVIGLIESSVARLRMTEIPKLLMTACVLSGLGILLS
ncbi:MAG TPA: NADH-quinone oxidoreductase subunit H [Pirellulales bacterium]|nr:NADH-quinone oxidoreductase subunit H [Pirellulales bacterium]